MLRWLPSRNIFGDSLKRGLIGWAYLLWSGWIIAPDTTSLVAKKAMGGTFGEEKGSSIEPVACGTSILPTQEWYSLMITFRGFLPGILAALLIASSFMGTASARAASSSGLTIIAEDPPTLVEHLRKELQSKEDRRRELALVDVIALANCPENCTLTLLSAQGKTLRIENDTGVGAAVDLNRLTPELLQAYRRSDMQDGLRLLALSALINVGNEKAIESLVQNPSSGSERVQRESNKILVSFFLEEYPELLDGARKKQAFSLDDVEKVRALRLKRVRLAQGN